MFDIFSPLLLEFFYLFSFFFADLGDSFFLLGQGKGLEFFDSFVEFFFGGFDFFFG
ncbi:MAG: hypothetical protein MRECE_13c001 [Mycoplasmataceae bacterium CE_OT135]|nr:MAG: hypothetical protein MRECE_13c001 [Mycoplasmataceae bacterium CE_OT135]